MTFKKRYKGKNNIVKYVPLLSIIGILFLTIGFAAFQNSLAINDIGATVRLQEDIRVTSVFALNSTSSASSNYEDYSVHNVYSMVNLPNSDSEITYEVEITNFGNVEMGIYNITEVYRLLGLNSSSNFSSFSIHHLIFCVFEELKKHFIL